MMDTLAWILVTKGDKKEDGARALALLQQAHAQVPRARDIRYHLAAALAKNGDRAGARKELEALAAGNALCPGGRGARAAGGAAQGLKARYASLPQAIKEVGRSRPSKKSIVVNMASSLIR